MSIRLVKPTLEYKNTFIKGINEYFDAKEKEIEGTGFIRSRIKDSYTDEEFNEEIISVYKQHEKGENLPSSDWPAYIETWIILDDQFVGAIFDKKYFTSKNSEIGGNIGYFVVPSFRRQGIMKQAMEQYLKQITSDKIIGYDHFNIGSKNVIEYLTTKFKNQKIEDHEVTYGDGKKQCVIDENSVHYKKDYV